MKKSFRYLKTFVITAVLLGLAGAAFSDAGEGPEPNAPPESQALAGPADNQEMPGPSEVSGPSNPSDSWDTYRIVVERNIFSRQRGPRVERTRRRVPVAPPAPDPESYVILKGIVQQDGEFIAFLEDTQTGQILRARQGDNVVRGKIAALTLDSLEYERDGSTTTIAMGSDLKGGRGAAAFTGMYEMTQAYSAPSGQATTTESSSPPSEDEAEILRQLMERRQQQIGQ